MKTISFLMRKSTYKRMGLLTYIALIAGSLGMYHTQLQCARFEIPTDISQKTKPTTIKVLLSKTKQPVLIEAKGNYRIYNPFNQLLLSSSATSKRDYLVYHPEGISWGDIFPNIFSLRVVPADAQSTILVDGIEYRGCIEIHAIQNNLNIINEIDIERYLKSTLACQFSEKLDNEVLEAVAIVARTNAYYLIKQDLNAIWHVDAKEVGYAGHALTLQNLQMQQSINDTRHMIMTYHDTAFPATWTMDSAGKTADFATIFRKDAKAPHGVSAPLAAKERPQHGWFFEISKQALARMLGAQKITEIDLYEDKDSQKIYAVRINNGTQSRNIDFCTFQKAIGTSLKSNDFTLEIKGDAVRFKGYGEGHGVGLCLLSASLLADKGEKAQQILKHFFPNTQLKHMTPTNPSLDVK